MTIKFAKYHALGNDFLVIEAPATKLTMPRLSKLALAICDRRTGVGADGILYLTKSGECDTEATLFNSDGGWAEKSGNGLRIVGYHLNLKNKKKKIVKIKMAGQFHPVRTNRLFKSSAIMSTELDKPEFETGLVPIRSRSKFMINAPLKIGGRNFPVTCVSVGNPHTVLFVDNFDFDWKTLGAEIEKHRSFPEHTNVEFVKIINRKMLQVSDWERGAGATSSSGTGAAASVCAAVMNGQAERKCEVVFESGSIKINWRESDSRIELTGPVAYIASGKYEF